MPLDVTSLIGVLCLGYDDWLTRLNGLAKAQNANWNALTTTYAGQITSAFDSNMMLNDTLLFRKSAYDNIFVNAPLTANRGVIDVLSALGTWPVHPLWPAAAGTLNPTVNPSITAMTVALGQLPVFWDYSITAPLQDAQEAAVFYRQFISDHLPVYVEFQI